MASNLKAVIQIVGFKNSGKTTASCELIRRFSEAGWKVGSVKHDAHDFEVDYPGKDTWKHREAGAAVVAITSKDKTAIMEQRGTSLEKLIDRMDGVDIVIVEGYKSESFPKILMLRNEGDFGLTEETNHILAIAAWVPFEHASIPVVSKDDFDQMFKIILKHIHLKKEVY